MSESSDWFFKTWGENPGFGGWVDGTAWERSWVDAIMFDYFAKQGPRESRVPLPVEVDAVLQDAVNACELASFNRPTPACGVIPEGTTAGDPLRCDLLKGHSKKIKHRNRKTGYTWWR